MYTAEISRSNPTAYIFLVDQSGSMATGMAQGMSKAEFVADVINKTLRDLVVRCTREEGVRDYFDIAVIGYGDKSVHSALSGSLSNGLMHPISAIADGTLRIDEREKMVDDGDGGIINKLVRFPVWVEPVANLGTPMRDAIATTARLIADWSQTHPNSYPVTVLHITDGESTDGDPEHNAEILRSLTTTDGQTLIYNLHVSADGEEPIRFPTSENQLPNPYSKLLFRMSSTFPEHLRRYAEEAHGIHLSAESHALVINADAEELVKFIDIGSRPAAMR